MGTLYLVRHGQASFGAEDYDRLSPMGMQQSVRLGEYFARKGVRFEAAITGTLVRHAQTYAGICKGAGLDLSPRTWPGLTAGRAGSTAAKCSLLPLPVSTVSVNCINDSNRKPSR